MGIVVPALKGSLDQMNGDAKRCRGRGFRCSGCSQLFVTVGVCTCDPYSDFNVGFVLKSWWWESLGWS